MKSVQNRLRSKVAWMAVLALVYFVTKTWFGFEIPGWDNFVILLAAAATAFGVFNDPTNPAGF